MENNISTIKEDLDRLEAAAIKVFGDNWEKDSRQVGLSNKQWALVHLTGMITAYRLLVEKPECGYLGVTINPE